MVRRLTKTIKAFVFLSYLLLRLFFDSLSLALPLFFTFSHPPHSPSHQAISLQSLYLYLSHSCSLFLFLPPSLPICIPISHSLLHPPLPRPLPLPLLSLSPSRTHSLSRPPSLSPSPLSLPSPNPFSVTKRTPVGKDELGRRIYYACHAPWFRHLSLGVSAKLKSPLLGMEGTFLPNACMML